MRKSYLIAGLVSLFVLVACGVGGRAGPTVATELVVVTATPIEATREPTATREAADAATDTPVPTPTPTLHPAFPTPEVGMIRSGGRGASIAGITWLKYVVKHPPILSPVPPTRQCPVPQVMYHCVRRPQPGSACSAHRRSPERALRSPEPASTDVQLFPG